MVSIIEITFVLSPLSILLVDREGVTEVSVIDLTYRYSRVGIQECHLLSLAIILSLEDVKVFILFYANWGVFPWLSYGGCSAFDLTLLLSIDVDVR